jgi:hypothetical protein
MEGSSMTHRTFYMLHVDGQRGPTARHKDKTAAVVEAKRLASQEKRAVFVLQATLMVEEDVQYIFHDLWDTSSMEGQIRKELER